MVCPVIYFDSVAAKKSAVYAISSAVPVLPTGIFFNNSYFISWGNSFVISVSIQPGAIQFTVIPLEATSLAIDCVNPIRPAFDAA